MPESAATRLTTLGPIELTGPDAAGCARVVAQPKRVALLAYLAARPAGERVSRDRILATFWPELSAVRAQGSLRNALYFLRRTLGPDVIVSCGNAVGVSPRHLGCDAADLLAASPATPEYLLLELYQGEFLDGLHVPGAPDFERWVDRTSAALRARATEIAWRLAEEAETAGEWISAARFARRAVDLSVDVEAATQRLIRLLDRAGDRGAAMSEYERLATVLEHQFGIEPSPETTALVRQVRERGGGPAADAAPLGAGSQRRPQSRSLAVLPFKDLSASPAGYLADGITENLLTALSGVHDVRIVSYATVRRFASRPPASMRAVRELLGVDLVLEGSVQTQADRVRITVQLVDARRDECLWAHAYDRRLTDVLEVQSDIALRIARALEAELSPREHHRIRRPPTTSLDAWRLYLKGREAWRNRNPEDASRAVSLFRRALDVDQRFGLAWVGLADAWLVRAATGGGSIADATAAAKEAVDRALACDPDLGEARATRGLILTFLEWDHLRAGAEYRRSIELSPGYATAHQWYGNWLCAHGRTEQGLAELEVAVELDPLSPAVSDSVGLGLYHAGRVDEAETRFRQTLDLDPGFWRARIPLSLCCASRGDLRAAAVQLVRLWAAGAYGARPGEAREAAKLVERDVDATLESVLRVARSRTGQVAAIRVIEILVLMLLGRHLEALTALEAARDDGSLGLSIMYAPMLDPLASDGRFHELMDSAGLLLPRWRKRDPPISRPALRLG